MPDEISAHFAEIYGASVPRETVSRINDKVVAEMNDWVARPLEAIYATIFVDAIYVKVRTARSPTDPSTRPSASRWTALCGRWPWGAFGIAAGSGFSTLV